MLFRTSWPSARSRTWATKDLTTSKLTSASSSARRISRIAREIASSSSFPRPRRSPRAPWSRSGRASNTAAKCRPDFAHGRRAEAGNHRFCRSDGLDGARRRGRSGADPRPTGAVLRRDGGGDRGVPRDVELPLLEDLLADEEWLMRQTLFALPSAAA